MYFSGVSPNGQVIAIPTPSPSDPGRVTLYGASSNSGSAPGGLLYRVASDSTTVETTYQFGRNNSWLGAVPAAGLIRGSDGLLYGATGYSKYDAFGAGATGVSTLFRISPDGSNYTKLFDFDDLKEDNRHYAVNVTGAEPRAPLVDGDEAGIRYVYGTCFRGGNDGTGTVFKARADGTGSIITLAHFGVAQTNSDGQFDVNLEGKLKNANGVNPDNSLIFGGDGYVYGVTTNGGPNGTGVIYRVPVYGGTIEVLHAFSESPVTDVAPRVSDDGAYPIGALILVGDRLYGTASALGPDGLGDVFSLNRDGSGFTVIHSFVNTDGRQPQGALIQTSDGLLTGTTNLGGTVPDGVSADPAGTIFKVSLDGTLFQTVHVFVSTSSATLESKFPLNGVIETSDGSLYGVSSGGYSGALFKYGTATSNDPLGVITPPKNGGGDFSTWLLGALAILGVLGRRHAQTRKRYA